MPWYGAALILACVVSSLIHVASIGKRVEFTPATAVLSLIISALEIWAIIALAAS